MALCCRQSAVSPRAHGLTNARWQLVHGDPNPWRPKTIAQRCGALIAASASAGSAFFKPFEDPEFLETTGANSIWSQAQHTREMVAIVEGSTKLGSTTLVSTTPLTWFCSTSDLR